MYIHTYIPPTDTYVHVCSIQMFCPVRKYIPVKFFCDTYSFMHLGYSLYMQFVLVASLKSTM